MTDTQLAYLLGGILVAGLFCGLLILCVQQDAADDKIIEQATEIGELETELAYHQGLSEAYQDSIRKYHAKFIFTKLQRDCLLHALQSAIRDDEPMGE